ncbi:MAG: hypothetical protein EXR76_05315 [Myxococcales bacterium]|nr:hypothetical protein [Myxococcales bacterium]
MRLRALRPYLAAYGLMALGLAACGDETTGDSGPAQERPRGSDGRVPGENPDHGANDAAGDEASDAVAAPYDGLRPLMPPDAGESQPECTDDGCGPGNVCYEGVCLEGERCIANDDCPSGRICVARICLADPGATGGLIAEPPALQFTYAEIGQDVFRNTTLVNNGNAVIEVASLTLMGSPLFTLQDGPVLPLRLVPDQRVDVAVHFQPDDENVEVGVLIAQTSDPAKPPVEVRLQSDHKMVGGESPCLQIRPNRADFGAVSRGDIGHRMINLVSCGNAPVSVLRIGRGRTFLGELSPHFGIAQMPAFPLVLAPGQQHVLDLTYAPGRAGLESGFWDVTSTDPATPGQRIDVTGMSIPPALEDVGLHIRVSWDTDLTDVDTHVLSPGGQMWSCDGDCYFSNPNPDWGVIGRWEDDAFLDVDDVDGFGPENVNIQEPIAGTYRVLIHYWDTHGGDRPQTTVEVLSHGNLLGSYGPVRMNDVDDNWYVVEIDWPAAVLREDGAYMNEARGDLCGGFNFP